MTKEAERTDRTEGAAALAFFIFSALLAVGINVIAHFLPAGGIARLASIVLLAAATGWLAWHVPTFLGWRLAGRATYTAMRARLAAATDPAEVIARGRRHFGVEYPDAALAAASSARGRSAVEAGGLLLLDEALEEVEQAATKIRSLADGVADGNDDPANGLLAATRGCWSPLTSDGRVRVMRLEDLARFRGLVRSHVARAHQMRAHARLLASLEPIHAAGHDPARRLGALAAIVQEPLPMAPDAAQEAIAERRLMMKRLRAARRRLAGFMRAAPALIARLEKTLDGPVALDLDFRPEATTMDAIETEIETLHRRITDWHDALGALRKLRVARTRLVERIQEVRALGHDPDAHLPQAVPPLPQPEGGDPARYAATVREHAHTTDKLTPIVARLDQTARTTAAIQAALQRYPDAETARPPPVFRPDGTNLAAIARSVEAHSAEASTWWLYARERGRTAEAMQALEQAATDYLGGRYAGVIR